LFHYHGKTLGFKDYEHVKYVDVVSSGVGITMVVKVIGGQGAKIIALFVVFENPKSKYPIRRVPDNIPNI
jgi:hypothetical protein